MTRHPQTPSFEADVESILAGLTHKPQATRSLQLVMMIGLPGSGKSTVARRLAPKIGATIVESDAVRALLVEKPTHTPMENRRVWDAVHEAARRLINEGVSTIIDGTNLTEADRRPVYKLADEANVLLIIVEVTADERVVSRRLKLREREEESRGSNMDWYDLYRRMRDGRQPISRQHFRIDTTDEAVAESVLMKVVAASREAGLQPAGASLGGRA